MLRTNQTFKAILLALLAVIVWAGNFVIARGVSKQIGPVSLAFYRWLLATILITPLAWKKFRTERNAVAARPWYMLWVSLSGITLFNTLVYVAGHYTSAINLALIGTTSSPIFATILAMVFLKDRPGWFRFSGMIICLSGIILLISHGSWQTLMAFRFAKGDIWVLGGAMAFAVYNVLVRRKSAAVSTIVFLFVSFAIGDLLLLPPFIAEQLWGQPIHWDASLCYVLLYLGAGTSIVSFLSWNLAIEKIGTGRTVLFGNLVPVFAILEAVWFLGEEITLIHIISGVIVVTGLILANLKLNKKIPVPATEPEI